MAPLLGSCIQRTHVHSEDGFPATMAVTVSESLLLMKVFTSLRHAANRFSIFFLDTDCILLYCRRSVHMLSTSFSNERN